MRRTGARLGGAQARARLAVEEVDPLDSSIATSTPSADLGHAARLDAVGQAFVPDPGVDDDLVAQGLDELDLGGPGRRGTDRRPGGVTDVLGADSDVHGAAVAGARGAALGVGQGKREFSGLDASPAVSDRPAKNVHGRDPMKPATKRFAGRS